MANDNPPPIAIIGSACRLPGNASSPSKLWELLLNPRDVLKEVPRDRFHWEGVYRPDGLHSSSRTKHGYWLEENIRMFDPQFFGINAAEAETIDPQHRLLLENVYEAMESAGLSLEDLQGTDVGVYVGMMGRNYFDNATTDLDASPGQILSTGTSRAMASNRISYTFDFRGPSLTIDTACSSSMMAVHLAVASLRSGESTLAFACGTNLNLNINDWVTLTRMNMVSPDGRSKMFDETANGYGRGEGTGVVCLKRLDAALRDGDYIECVIRETGTNQDGRTIGITAPSAEAQAALIRKTYKSAGLDPTQLGSRPSYFEAHGTGTFVGDPLEAAAVQASFFPPGRDYSDDETLYIGSIKTIVGHTEGTAGIAGLLRAGLAVRYGFIPPNALFTRMNPQVAPFTKHLRVATAANPWPLLPDGCPRRASINSFGFGGSNVHVIVESYEDPASRRISSMPSFGIVEPNFTPFTFSAMSGRSLTAVMENCLAYLEDPKSTVSLRNLAWTLQYKRTQFPYRCPISALTLEELRRKLHDAIRTTPNDKGPSTTVRSSKSNNPRIMGVFTGQGSQWATMGKDLINRSPYAREFLEKLDDSLASLPKEDRPKWKITEELAIGASQSRMNEALLSQPLTTAIQLLLVDLLDIAGVSLHAVVGHSSGEIAAAYAAGMVKAEDAIRIAYYRGLHSRHAIGSHGQTGAMLVAGLSPEEARSFCDLPDFNGRLVPAAYNSPSLVTLSGDVDAVDLALESLGTQTTFARKLNVEKAYHSHHMQPCVGPYVESLENCGVPVLPPFEDSPIWFSSVYPGKRMDPAQVLEASYWAENLKLPVRFSEAVATAISEVGVPDVVLEIGPHAALEKPVREIIGDAERNEIVYTGLLKRGSNSIVAVSEALGQIWARFGRTAVNFTKYDRTLARGSSPHLVKNLPTYPWLHDREYWWENRFLRRQFQSAFPPNELLGRELSMTAQHEMKWRHFLEPQVVHWFLDHKLNGVAVLPAAAYVAMAATAARRLFQKHSIQMIEVGDLLLKLPLAFPDDTTTIETVLTISNITSTASQGQANFIVDFCSHQRQDDLMTAAQGRLTVHFGVDLDRSYPGKLSQHAALTTLDPDVFYDHLDNIGYKYTGPFRCITSLRRRMDFATGQITYTPSEMMFHPGILDGLFHAAFAGESFPGDSAMRNCRVPALVRSVKIYPTRCDEMSTSKEPANFDIVRTGAAEYGGSLYCADGIGTVMQMEGLCLTPFKINTAEDDLKMFSEIVWRPYILDGRALASKCVVATHPREPALACERVALFYLRRLLNAVNSDEERRVTPHLQHLLEFARFSLCEALLGLRSHISPEWFQDTENEISTVVAQYSDVVDIRLLDAIGKAYPQIIQGQLSALDVLTKDGMLTEFYQRGLGFPEANSTLTNVVSAISQRSPNMHILEVGAGTSSVTGSILCSAAYSSYTFTDISPALLGPAKEKFKPFADKMTFSVLDLEKDINEQEFQNGPFQIVIASNVLHTLTNTTAGLARIRQLLRPGGYLVCIELPDTLLIKNTVIMGGLPGWWVGKESGRTWSPALTRRQWFCSLRDAGFAGLDAITPVNDDLLQSYQVFVSQAVDDRVAVLRDPINYHLSQGHDSLIVIGGNAIAQGGLVSAIKKQLSPSFREIVHLSGLDDIKEETTVSRTVLCLVELDKPVFQDMTARKWSALRKLFTEASDVLWVTTGCKSPSNIQAVYKQMMIGLGRTVRNEIQDLRLRFVDVDDMNVATAQRLTHIILEWFILGQWAAEGWQDEVLFGHDTELAIENGVTLVPTVVHSGTQNDRYNSQQRRVLRAFQPHDSPIEVVFTPSNQLYDIREMPHRPAEISGVGMIPVKMICSTLYAIKIKKADFLYIGLGTCPDGERAMVLTETMGSLLQVPSHAIFPCTSAKTSGKDNLWATVADLVAENVVTTGKSKGSLVVFTSDALIISLIREKAAEQGKSVMFLTSDPNFALIGAQYVHHSSMDVHLRQMVPGGTSLLANLSNRPEDETLFRRITALLKDSCTKIKSFETIFRTQSSGYDYTRHTGNEREITAKMEKYLGHLPSAMDGCPAIQAISPQAVAHHSPRPPLTILDWTAAPRTAVSMHPATDIVRFSPNKSYIVIGSSDLAQSLCELMINNGAKHIVMASRNPRGLTGWVQDMGSRGAAVDIKSVDLTSGKSVGDMLASVRSTRHNDGVARPIGGVIHLSMALKDGMFSKMSFEDLQLATNVKAKGSLHLHEHLSADQLDFFILTSSISYILGNQGQANYNCGNAFMVGLANYRRNVGLPASVVDLGFVMGVGYAARTANGTAYDLDLESLRKKGMYPISERDLHHIFAEAVLASPADSDRSPEIITGLRSIEPDMLEHPSATWAKQPMFAHLLTKSITEKAQDSKPQLSVREKICEELASDTPGSSNDSIASIEAFIRTALVDRLSILLQMDSKNIDAEVSLLELGIDSLVASDIGNWAKKELRVQVPHAMIFGGASVVDIVKFAVEHFDKGWVMLNGGMKGRGKGKV